MQRKGILLQEETVRGILDSISNKITNVHLEDLSLGVFSGAQCFDRTGIPKGR